MRLGIDLGPLLRAVRVPPPTPNGPCYPEELRYERWILIELQGTLAVSNSTQSLAGLDLGNIQFLPDVRIRRGKGRPISALLSYLEKKPTNQSAPLP